MHIYNLDLKKKFKKHLIYVNLLCVYFMIIYAKDFDFEA